MLISVIEFLSAYYPRYLCLPCLANLMSEPEADVRAAVVPSGLSLEYAMVECLNCTTLTRGIRRTRNR
jgi:hypothetical protein